MRFKIVLSEEEIRTLFRNNDLFVWDVHDGQSSLFVEAGDAEKPCDASNAEWYMLKDGSAFVVDWFDGDQPWDNEYVQVFDRPIFDYVIEGGCI